jgi:hypothetical protein
VVRIVRVHDDTPATELGVRAGDLMLGYGHTDWWGDYRESPFRNADELADFLRANARRTVPVIVLRGDSVLEGRLTVRG